MTRCLICKNGEIVERERSIEWYECTYCGADNNRLAEGGVLYPLWRRGTLCSQYTPVVGLEVQHFHVGDTVSFLTNRKSQKKANVIHVDEERNQMILEDLDTGRVRLLVDEQEIDDAYDALFPENKRKFAGWWNRRIELQSEVRIGEEKNYE